MADKLGLLVVTRRLGERTYLVDKTTKTVLAQIVVVDIDKNKVRIGLKAPDSVGIYREEIAPDYVKNEQTPPGTGQHPSNLRIAPGTEAAGAGAHVPPDGQ